MEDAGARSDADGAQAGAADAVARDDHRVRPENVRAESLKERVYATFTGLAIVLVQLTNVEHLTTPRVASELAVGILAITAAGLAADVISFLSVHARFPDGHEVRVMLRIAASALASAGIPVAVLALSALAILQLDTALRIVSIVYVVTLGLIAYLGVRRTRAAWWKQLIALASLMAVGLSVIFIQAAAHGH